jgi:hypothetical protein
MGGLVEWYFPQIGVIQVVQDTDRAGRSLLTFGTISRKSSAACANEASTPARWTTRPRIRCCSGVDAVIV